MKKTMLKTHFVYSLLFVLLIALDRVTKNWASHTLIKQDIDVIPDVLCFHYLENAGAAWESYRMQSGCLPLSQSLYWVL